MKIGTLYVVDRTKLIWHLKTNMEGFRALREQTQKRWNEDNQLIVNADEWDILFIPESIQAAAINA
jgi:hypothetical protein